ncbi:MAG: complex I NDUFA9 subunit family protein [Steroidobacteraceae bacterium]
METRQPELTVCVLGGTGFVGTELVTRLARDGHWVRVATRTLGNNDRLRVLDTVRLIRADVHDPRVLTRLFSGVDLVVNLIGILNEHGRATFKSVHVDLAGKVVAAARTAGVKRLLHMSSVAADAEAAPSKYLRCKGQAEARVRASAAPLGWTIFRPSVIFGEGDSLTNRFARLLRLSGGFLPLARAGARFAPVSVEDVAEAFRRAAYSKAAIGQTYELCGPQVLTLEEVVRITAEVAGLRCSIVRLPDFVAFAQAVFMNFLPGKPFSVDNYKSLTIDAVCREDGCARLGIKPHPMLAVLPTYLGDASKRVHLDSYHARH